MSIRPVTLVALLALSVVSTARALPDEVKAELSTGSGPVAVAFSDDDRVVVTVDEDGASLSVIDTADFAGGATTATTCSGPRTLRYAGDSGAFVVACEQGVLARASVSIATFPASLTSLTDIQLSETDDLLDLALDGTEAWALSDAGRIFHVELSTSTETTDGYYPIDLSDGGGDDDDDSAATLDVDPVALAVSSDGSTLIVALADGDLVEVALDDEDYLLTYVSTGEDDLVGVVGQDPFYLLSSAGTVMSYEAGSYAPLTLAVVTEGGGLTTLTDDGADLLAVAGGNQLTYIDVDTGLSAGSATLPGDGDAVAVSTDGYAAVVDNGNGVLQVLTDNPWVSILSTSPDSLTEDEIEDITLTLTTDADGALQVLLEGDIDASGTDLAPDQTQISGDVETEVVVTSELMTSGYNTVFVFAEDDDGKVGRAATQIYMTGAVDIPAPEGFSVTAGNGKVELAWAEVDEVDVSVDHYVVYFSDTSFDPDDGEVVFCSAEDEEMCSPTEVLVTASAAWLSDGEGREDDDTADDDTADDDTADDDTGDDDTGDDDTGDDGSVSVTLSPLTNGTLHYFAVAAVDIYGEVGTFTGVVSAMPQETGGAAWLAGDPGGYGCDGCTVTGNPGGELVVLGVLGVLAVLRRSVR
jgi:MYXO-CTERM domain-containing protein